MKANGQLPIQELEKRVKELEKAEESHWTVWAAIGPDGQFLKDKTGQIIASTSPVDVQSEVAENYPELAKKKTCHLKPLTKEYLNRIKSGLSRAEPH